MYLVTPSETNNKSLRIVESSIEKVSLIISKKGEYGSCRQLFPHMQKLGCALSKHLFVQCRIEAFYRKCFKKLAISLVLTMTQDIKVSIVEIVFSTLCRFSQVILDL